MMTTTKTKKENAEKENAKERRIETSSVSRARAETDLARDFSRRIFQTAVVLLAVSSIGHAPAASAAQKQQPKTMMKIGDDIVSNEIGKDFVRAQGFIDARDYDQAASVLKMLLAGSPNIASIHYKYAFVLLQQSKYDEALNHAQKCTEIAPTFFGGWSLVGEALLELKRDDQALKAFKQALTLQPTGENAEIIKERIDEIEHPPEVSTADDTVQNEQIKEQNRAAMKLNRALALCESATQHAAQKQFDQGLQDCRDALNIAPNSDRIRENFVVFVNNYAAACVQKEQYKQAEALMKEALAFQQKGGVSAQSRATTLKNYSALLNFLGRGAEAKAVEAQMKSNSATQ